MREAALLAAGNLEELLEAGGGSPGGLDVSALLDNVVQEDLAPAGSACNPFLQGRALWLGSK